MAIATRGVVPVSSVRRPRREHWRALLEAQRRSGLSLAAFCRRRGVRNGTLSFWKWKLTHEAAADPAAPPGRTPGRAAGLRAHPARGPPPPRGDRGRAPNRANWRSRWPTAGWSGSAAASISRSSPRCCARSRRWGAEPAPGGADLRGDGADEHAPVVRSARRPGPGRVQQDPLSGHLFAFFNRPADRVKILYWDRSGFCLWYKRLERGVFHLPRAGAATLELDAADLMLLLDGIDLRARSGGAASSHRWGSPRPLSQGIVVGRNPFRAPAHLRNDGAGARDAARRSRRPAAVCRALLAELGEKQQLIDKLSHQLALFRRYVYGRRSEQLDPAQLLLEFASWVQARAEHGGGAGARGRGPVPTAARAWPHAAARAAAPPAGGAPAAGGALHLHGLRRAPGQDRRGDERAARLPAGLAVRHRARALHLRLSGV